MPNLFKETILVEYYQELNPVKIFPLPADFNRATRQEFDIVQCFH